MRQVPSQTPPPNDRRLRAVERQSIPSRERSIGTVGLFLITIAFSVFLRSPLAKLNLPYLYNIDDAPAFDWTVEIIKSGSLHPGQFIKPAFPIYLLFPAVGIGFLKGVEHGELRKFEEISSANPFGDHGHEYTVSHPTVVKYVRLFCIAIALSAFVAIYYLGVAWRGGPLGALSALLLSLSPAHLVFSPMMWFVSDHVATFFVLLSALLAVQYLRNGGLSLLAVSSAAAGLAVSSKYNIFPIVLVPAFAWLLSIAKRGGMRPTTVRFWPWPVGLALVFIVAAAAFVLGSPYSLLAYREFLDGAAWQVWAYKRAWVDVEVNHFGQLTFYVQWLGQSGVGWGVLCAALMGAVVALVLRESRAIAALLLLYPVVFVWYMCGQKINYVQNMVSVLPFLCLFAAYFAVTVAQAAQRARPRMAFPAAAIVAIIIAGPSVRPLWAVWESIEAEEAALDSRDSVLQWTLEKTKASELIAVAGELQMPHPFRRLSRVQQVRGEEIKEIENILPLWQAGTDYLIAPSWLPSFDLPIIKQFPGHADRERILRNPQVNVIALNSGAARALLLPALREDAAPASAVRLSVLSDRRGFEIPLVDNSGWSGLGEYEQGSVDIAEASGYRWLSSRYTELRFENLSGDCDGVDASLALIGFSPWSEQELELFVDGAAAGGPIGIKQRWQSLNIPLSPKAAQKLFTPGEHALGVLIKETGSLAAAGLSEDVRQLGVALHTAALRLERSCALGNS